MKTRRVVITGLGALTPVGNNVNDTWKALVHGQCGVGPITRFDATNFATKIAAEVKGFDVTTLLPHKDARKIDVFVQFALEASRQALLDAGLLKDDALTLDPKEAEQIGVAIGSGIGGMPWIEKNAKALFDFGPRKISPFFIPGAIINMAAGMVSIRFGVKGPNISIVTACTTGLHNIGIAARMIACGDAEVMIAGGAEMATTPLGIGGFSAVRALSRCNDAPEKASRPWDKDRDGFVLGEGAASVILEDYERARARGVPIYAEVIGFGMSGDAYHITAPDPEGVGFCRAMQNAMKDAGVAPHEIDYVNAHGTSTPAADHLEASAIKSAFGQEQAAQLAVSSTKSMTGHMLGAAGAIETIISILAIRDNVAPPTINLDTPSEGCDLDFVPLKKRSMNIDCALSNSFGFGGTNASIILRSL